MKFEPTQPANKIWGQVVGRLGGVRMNRSYTVAGVGVRFEKKGSTMWVMDEKSSRKRLLVRTCVYI